MLQLLASVFVIVLVGFMLFAVFSKHKAKSLEDLPSKYSAVQALFDELIAQRLLILPSASSQQLSPVLMSIFEIAKLVDEKNELSRSRYDDDPVLFHSPEPIISCDKLPNNRYLPRVIMEEVKNFCGAWNQVSAEGTTNFFLILPAKQHYNRQVLEHDELFCSEADAFSTWLDFKESANNLCFVVQQWLDEHRLLLLKRKSSHLS